MNMFDVNVTILQKNQQQQKDFNFKLIIYNMKSKYQSGITKQFRIKSLEKDLHFLQELAFLREDSLLFHKLILLQKNKQLKNTYLNKLWQLQFYREQTQTTIIKYYMKEVIADASKNILFQYSSKIYKTIKYFYLKIMNYWPNYLQVSESSSFIQQVRKFSIQILSVNNNNEQNKIKATIGDFLQVFQRQLRQKFQRQINLIQAERIFPNQNTVKNVKFIQLLQDMDHLFKFYQMAHQKIKKQMQDVHQKQLIQKDSKIDKFTANCCRLVKINEEINRNQFGPNQKKNKCQNRQTVKMQQDILDLQIQTKSHFQLITSYKQEGIIQFYMNKQTRMHKDLMIKNISNQKQIQNFFQKTKKIKNDNNSYVNSCGNSNKNIKEKIKQTDLYKLDKVSSKNTDNRRLLKIKQKYLTLQNDSCPNSIQVLKNNKQDSNKYQKSNQEALKSQLQYLQIKQFVLNTDKCIKKTNPYRTREPLTLRLSTKQDKRQSYRQQSETNKKQRIHINQRSNSILKQVRQALDIFVQNYSDKQNTLKIDCKQQNKKLQPQTPAEKIKLIQTDFLRCKNKRYRITSIPHNRSYKIRSIQPTNTNITTLQAELSKNLDKNTSCVNHQKQNQEVFISKTVKYESKGQCLVLDDFALKENCNNSK